MAIRIVQLGSSRDPAEGLRLGTVRFPPRGVPKGELAARDFYDVWLPILAPTAELIRTVRAGGDTAWRRFSREFAMQMRAPEAARTLDLLAALSHHTNLSIGCYCDDEARCHRSILRQLLLEREALIASARGRRGGLPVVRGSRGRT